MIHNNVKFLKIIFWDFYLCVVVAYLNLNGGSLVPGDVTPLVYMTYACSVRMTKSGPLRSLHLDGQFFRTAYQSKDVRILCPVPNPYELLDYCQSTDAVARLRH